MTGLSKSLRLLLTLCLLSNAVSSLAELNFYRSVTDAEIELAHSVTSDILFEFDNLDSSQYVFQITDEAVVQITFDETVSDIMFNLITKSLNDNKSIKGVRSRHGQSHCFQ